MSFKFILQYFKYKDITFKLYWDKKEYYFSINKVKITVLKTHLDKELVKEYGVENLSACPMHFVGETYYADYAKPERFCDEAWKAIYQYVFALAHGAKKEVFYFGDWIKKLGVAICSCNDGLRPVIFKIEATNIPTTLNYAPIR